VKRIVAGLITLLILGGVLWYGRGKPPASAPAAAAADTPETCIERMFTAAQRGDVTAYLDCFAGSERDRLERELSGRPPADFARSLRDAVATLKGRAVFRNGPAEIVSDPASYTIDRVYESRSERQLYQLSRQSGVWRIQSVATANPFQPGKPYGSPVYDEPAAKAGKSGEPSPAAPQ
jgi:hypothetical protein